MRSVFTDSVTTFGKTDLAHYEVTCSAHVGPLIQVEELAEALVALPPRAVGEDLVRPNVDQRVLVAWVSVERVGRIVRVGGLAANEFSVAFVRQLLRQVVLVALAFLRRVTVGSHDLRCGGLLFPGGLLNRGQRRLERPARVSLGQYGSDSVDMIVGIVNV